MICILYYVPKIKTNLKIEKHFDVVNSDEDIESVIVTFARSENYCKVYIVCLFLSRMCGLAVFLVRFPSVWEVIIFRNFLFFVLFCKIRKIVQVNQCNGIASF